MTKIAIVGLIALASANAGQIQIGGTNGLTNSYITTANGGVGSTGTFNEQNYDTNLFFGATESGTAPTPYAGYNQTAGATGTLTDTVNNITFSMVNDGVAATNTSIYGQASNVGQSNNVWVSTSTGNDTITVPVGVFDVTGVWTMLNTELGGAGSLRDADVTLDFSTTANGSSGITQIQFKPTNTDTTATGGTHFGIMNGDDCTGGSGCTGTGYGATGGNDGLSNPSSTATPVNLTNGAITYSAQNYYTQNLFGTNNLYNSAVGSEANTSGFLSLQDLGYVFSGSLATYAASQYLVSVQITEAAGTQSGASALGLSAVTVTTGTPEPSTVFLLLSGLGAIGFGRFRRRK